MKLHDLGIHTVFCDPNTGPPSPGSPRTGGATPRDSWASRDWSDDEQNLVDHNTVFAEHEEEEEEGVFAEEEEEEQEEKEEEEEEVCLFPTVWRKWTRGIEEVCLFNSIWQKWTRTHPRNHGKVRRSRGRRTTLTQNKKRRHPRRRQEKRRRRALRRKKLVRRARVGGGHRPRACYRGGANSGEEDKQVGAR